MHKKGTERSRGESACGKQLPAGLGWGARLEGPVVQSCKGREEEGGPHRPGLRPLQREGARPVPLFLGSRGGTPPGWVPISEEGLLSPGVRDSAGPSTWGRNKIRTNGSCRVREYCQDKAGGNWKQKERASPRHPCVCLGTRICMDTRIRVRGHDTHTCMWACPHVCLHARIYTHRAWRKGRRYGSLPQSPGLSLAVGLWLIFTTFFP